MDESLQLTVLLIIVLIIGVFFLYLLRKVMSWPSRVAKKVTDKTKEKTGQKLTDVRQKIHTKKEKRRAASQGDRRSNDSIEPEVGLLVREEPKELRKKLETWKKKLSRKKLAKDLDEGAQEKALVSEPMSYPGEPLPA